MADTRQIRADELKRLILDAQSRIEQLSAWRLVIAKHDAVDATNGERVWLLQAIDNRRVLMLERIENFNRALELARENAQPEIGVLFIDGRKHAP